MAVFIDFVVLCALGIGILLAALNLVPALDHPVGGYLWLGLFLAIDFVMTALWGLSLGRLALGIRVIRLDDGAAPGPLRAIGRIAIVTLSGIFAIVSRGNGRRYLGLPDRFWWDQAVGTVLVRLRQSASNAEFTPEDLARLRTRLQR